MPIPPNLADYASEREAFSWASALGRLDGLPGGKGLNIAHETVDRHAKGPMRQKVAVRWLGKDGRRRQLTYADLSGLTGRFADVLATLGIGKGDRVLSLCGRIAELYVAALGTLKNRSVFCPLFTSFGPEPIRTRLKLGEARVLVTTPSLYRRKVEPLRASLPRLEHVLLIRPSAELELPEGTRDLRTLLEEASPSFEIPPTEPSDLALLHFTSGTTGPPKGVLHVHEALLAQDATGRSALDLHPEDVFWCTADPGWATFTAYGIVAPLSVGATVICDEAELDGERWYSSLERERVSVWYTTPTSIRMLMQLGLELPRRFDLSSLRFVASVGEPLDAEAVLWGQKALGVPIHDNWSQTETGAIMIANFRGIEVRPGSMGLAVPGVVAAVVRRVEPGRVEPIEEPMAEGEVALAAGWPSMFRGYLGEQELYRRCFASGWYLTGDLARRDRDGYFWFLGRADDVIKSCGQLIGPFEVESVLLEHPAVAEAAVVGKPDRLALELVKAFVTLTPGHLESEALRLELLAFARRRLGGAMAPKEIEFLPLLPKNRSGKILRRLLKERERQGPGALKLEGLVGYIDYLEEPPK
ncbi:MAG: acetate--CoA ligase [Myxococcaceae bacterium]